MKRFLVTLALFCRMVPALGAILWTEGMEGPFPPPGWIENSVDQVSTYAFNGEYSARLNAASDYLITPELSGESLIFWTYTTAADPLIVVEHAPHPDGPWAEAEESPFSGYTGQWNGRFIDLSDLGSVYVRFRKTGTGTLYLDDIALDTGDGGPVNRPPVFEPVGDRFVPAGGALSFSVTAADADGDLLVLRAENLPDGAVFHTVTNSGSVSGVFTWDPAGTAGTYAPVFYVTDGAASVSRSIVITVGDPPPDSAFWNVVYNLPQQSSSGTLYPGQFHIRDTLVSRIDALQAGHSAILATFTFSANEGAGPVLNAVRSALDRGAQISFIADGNISLATVYGGTHSLFSLANRSSNPLILSVDSSLSGIMHHKFGLFDYGGGDQHVFTASWNFTLAASASQWNIALEAKSSSLYTLYAAEAAELLAGRFQGHPEKSRAHDGQPFDLPGSWGANSVRFAPYPEASSGGNNAERDLVRLIEQAQEEIVFALNKLNRWSIRDALIAAADRGIRIRGVIPNSDSAPDGVSAQIVDDLNDPSRYASASRVQFLSAYAAADYSRTDSGESDLIHTKYMIIDPESETPVVIHGSPNWTAAGLASTVSNDENMLILRHSGIAGEFHRHFQRMTGTGPFKKGNSVLVQWDFNDGDAVADGGIPDNANAVVRRVPEPSAYNFISGALSANGWDSGAGGKYWETSFSTVQHKNIQVSSVQISTATGPSAFRLQYKTGEEEEYRDVPGGEIRVDTGRGGELFRLPLPEECDHQPQVFLRWMMTDNTAVNGNNVSAGGAGRIDDILIAGTTYDQPPVLDPIGNRDVFEGQPLSFQVHAADLIDGDPVFMSADGLPPGALFEDGVFMWERAVPSGSYMVTFYAVDKDGAVSETVVITVSPLPKLFISEIADPAGTGGNAYRFVELYNAGDEEIDLAAEQWHLSRQVNGGNTWYDVALTGKIAPSGTYLIAKGRDDFMDAYGFEPDQESSRVDGNGDDAYFLFRGGNRHSGMLVDIYGEMDTDGTGTDWEYERSRAVRSDHVLQPSPVWKADEWIILAGSGTDAMTPGQHGPRPVFLPFTDPFVFCGDDLYLAITAVNTVRTDMITLSANSLPSGAVFHSVEGVDSVAGILSWMSPPEGIHTAEFSASGQSGRTAISVSVTVSSRSRIEGPFHGWSGETVFKFENGQFWKQTASGSKTVSPPLFRPAVTVTNVFGQRRMIVDRVPGYTAVVPLSVSEHLLNGKFSGLRYENLYTLDDGTVWKQISHEIVSSSGPPAVIWRWTSGGKQKLRFLDSGRNVIGTVIAEAAGPDPAAPVITEIDGWFRGWGPRRMFALANGEFWQQISPDRSSQTLFRPEVTLINWLESGRWRMHIAQSGSSAGFVEVRKVANAASTEIDGLFSGFGAGNYYKLADGSWRRQRSADISTSVRFSPRVLIWSEDSVHYMELPDEGRCIEVDPIFPLAEDRIISSFTGLGFGRLYHLDEGRIWRQISFDTLHEPVENPSVMLWNDGGFTRMVVRRNDGTILGECMVVCFAAGPGHDHTGGGEEVPAVADPPDTQSGFRIRQIKPDKIGWDAEEGRVYTVEWTPSLTAPFQALATNITWPQNSWTIESGGSGAEGFFRVRAGSAD